MGELYSSWSPYVYTVNNPVVLTDPNGKWISVFGKDGTEYRYENGEMKKQNHKGEWESANYYFGGDEYVADIYYYLLKISGFDETSFGSQFLALFNNDEINVVIKKNIYKNKDLIGKNFHRSGEIYTDFDQKDAPKPYHLTLFHEISHGYSYSRGFQGRNDEWFKYQKSETSEGTVKKDEIYAVLMENLLRFEQGYQARTHYHTGKVIERTGKTPNGSIIYTPTKVAEKLIDRYFNLNQNKK